MQERCLVTYPCPARNPRLEGLTLSLNISISMLWHSWLDEARTEEHSSTTHHWSASPLVTPVTCWSLTDMGLKKASSGRSESSEGSIRRMDVKLTKLISTSKWGSRHTTNNPTLPVNQRNHINKMLWEKKWLQPRLIPSDIRSIMQLYFLQNICSKINVQETTTNLLASWLPFWTQVLWDPWWTLAAGN